MLEGVEEKWGSGPASQALSTESHVARGAAAWGSAREKEGIPIPPPPVALDKCEGAEACWGALSTPLFALPSSVLPVLVLRGLGTSEGRLGFFRCLPDLDCSRAPDGLLCHQDVCFWPPPFDAQPAAW